MKKILLPISLLLLFMNVGCFEKCKDGFEKKNFFAQCKAIENKDSSSTSPSNPADPNNGSGGGGSADPYANVNLSYNNVAPYYLYDSNSSSPNPVVQPMTPNSNLSDLTLLSDFRSIPELPNGLILNPNTGVITGTTYGLWDLNTYTISAQKPGGSGRVSTTISFGVLEPSFDPINTPPAIYDPLTPRNFTYSNNEAIYYVGVPAANNLPTHVGEDFLYYTYPGTYSSANGIEQFGLTFDTNTGIISGTAIAPMPRTEFLIRGVKLGSEAYTLIHLTILDGPPLTLTYDYTNSVYPLNTAITPNSPSHTGGNIVSYSISPALPPGLSFNTTTGVISGAPTSLSTATLYTVTATNAAGSKSQTISIAVDNSPPANLSYTYSSARFTVGAIIQDNTPSIGSGGTPTSYQISPSLPAGLSFNTSTGVISGTPTASKTNTTYTITATNAIGSTTHTIDFVVVQPGPHTIYSSDGNFIKAYSVDVLTGEPIYVGNSLASTVRTKLLFHPTADCAFGASGSTLYSFSVNKVQNGALTPVNTAGNVSSPTTLTLLANGSFIYILNGGSSVSYYSANSSNCEVTYQGTLNSSAVDIATAGTNLYLFTSSAQIKHFSVDTNTGVPTFVQNYSMTPHGNPPSIGNTYLGTGLYLRASADGAYLFSNDSLRAFESFSVNATTGALSSISSVLNTGTYFRAPPTYDATNNKLYSCFDAANWAGITTLNINASGGLSFVGDIISSDIVSYYAGPRSIDVFTSESGTYVYTTYRYIDYSRSGAIRLKFDPTNNGWHSYGQGSGLWGGDGVNLFGTLSGY